MKFFSRFAPFFLLILLWSPASIFSEDESSQLNAADQRLTLLEAKAKRLKNLQDEIRLKQSEIDKNLDALSIQIQR